MIRTFRHSGLEAFYLTDSKRGIQPAHATKLRVLLTALEDARSPRDLKAPAWRLHKLSGDMAEHWSMWVNGNWRLTFRFVGEDVDLVDYQDYH